MELVGKVTRHEVAEWLGRFDVFLFPSTCEGCAGATQEALSSGLPVVASHNAGSTVRHELDGFLFDYDDITGFVEALERLDDDRSLLRRLGQSAANRALEFGLDPYAERLAEAMRRILSRRFGP